ncbi:MAG: phage scaffolding protein [Clostridia bacterium]|nr:phage scaffolding protein [Clostridia bacterium]
MRRKFSEDLRLGKDTTDKIMGEYGRNIEKYKSNVWAKNAKAVKALLDMDDLKLNSSEIVGLSQQLEKIKAENDYLFKSSYIQPQIVKAASNTDVS